LETYDQLSIQSDHTKPLTASVGEEKAQLESGALRSEAIGNPGLVR
jgi:hypothetical protein